MKRDLNTVRVAVRAIDVGYYNTKFTLGRERDGRNESTIATKMFPSLTPRYAEALSALPGAVESGGRVVTFDGLDYYVGQDSVYCASGSVARSISHDFSRSTTYRVLTYAALAEIAEKAGGFAVEIDRLVVGLPCNTFKNEAPALEKWLCGQHRITTNGRQVLVAVEHVHVIPQPLGALLDYCFESGHDFDGWALIVDPGGGTLDWFCTTKERGNWGRSGAYPKSMLACSYAVCDAIHKEFRDSYEVVSRVDNAIRGQSSTFRANGNTYQIADYQRQIDDVVIEALDKMMESVGKMFDLDLILVAGGGGRLFAKALRTRYPEVADRVTEWSEEPIFANVRGFHAFGEQMRAA